MSLRAAPAQGMPRSLRLAVLSTALCLVAGIGYALIFADVVADRWLMRPITMYYIIYARQEPLAISLLLLLLAGWVAVYTRCQRWPDWLSDANAGKTVAMARWLLPVAVLLAGGSGTWWASQNHLLIFDEFMATFQAKIFLSGHVIAPIPPEWREFERALRPNFASYHADVPGWTSSYWPVYALLRAPFVACRAEWLCNPVFTALAVWLTGRVARRLWPDCRGQELLAMGLLAGSTQVLAMATTGFAMAAHLAFNLWWMELWLRKDRWGWFWLPWVGLAAMMLHKPQIHLLLALPFLFLVVWEKRWAAAIWLAAAYAVNVGLCLAWPRSFAPSLIAPGSGVVAGASALLEWPHLVELLLRLHSIPMMAAWQSLACVLLLAFSVQRLAHWNRLEWALAAGAALLWGFYWIGRDSPATGWGYRYAHPFLGHLVLLAAGSWPAFRRLAGAVRAHWTLLFVGGLSILVFLPLRAWQMADYIRPYAALQRWVENQQADFLLTRWSYPGGEWVRTAPDCSNSPKVMWEFALDDRQREELARRGRVMILDRATLEKAMGGAHVMPLVDRAPPAKN